MSRPPEFKTRKTPSGWLVTTPAVLSTTGNLQREFFRTRELAGARISELKRAYRDGERASILPANVALEATRAIEILNGSGISLIEAARMAVAKAKSEPDREPFLARYVRSLAEMRSVWSPRYARDMASLPGWVPAWFLSLPCGAIDRTTMERALTETAKLARSTIDNRSRYLSAIIGYRERHRKSSEIAILSTMERLRLLRACETREERRAVAMLLYAGIRPDAEMGEIRRLDWSAVGESEIYVSREVSKVSDRHIPISKKLRREIRGHPKSGLVVPSSWKKTWTRLRKAASVTAQDVCRHTFASHALMAFGEQSCKAQMGHTAGSSTLMRHYRRAVTEAQGRRYFR